MRVVRDDPFCQACFALSSHPSSSWSPSPSRSRATPFLISTHTPAYKLSIFGTKCLQSLFPVFWPSSPLRLQFWLRPPPDNLPPSRPNTLATPTVSSVATSFLRTPRCSRVFTPFSPTKLTLMMVSVELNKVSTSVTLPLRTSSLCAKRPS